MPIKVTIRINLVNAIFIFTKLIFLSFLAFLLSFVLLEQQLSLPLPLFSFILFVNGNNIQLNVR